MFREKLEGQLRMRVHRNPPRCTRARRISVVLADVFRHGGDAGIRKRRRPRAAVLVAAEQAENGRGIGLLTLGPKFG